MDYLRIYPEIYLLREKLYCTIGQDENVRIGELRQISCSLYEIFIHVRGQSRAEALRTIIPVEYSYGEDRVCTKVCCQDIEIMWCLVPQKSQREVANLFCRALSSNYLFKGVKLGPDKLLPITNEITVFIHDEWIRLYEPVMYEECVARVFSQVLKLRYGLLIVTRVRFRAADCYCPLKCLYCKKEY